MGGAIIVTHIPLMILNYVDGDQEPRRHLQTPSLAPPEGDQPPHCNPPRLKTLSPKLSPWVDRRRRHPGLPTGLLVIQSLSTSKLRFVCFLFLDLSANRKFQLWFKQFSNGFSLWRVLPKKKKMVSLEKTIISGSWSFNAAIKIVHCGSKPSEFVLSAASPPSWEGLASCSEAVPFLSISWGCAKDKMSWYVQSA